MLLLLFWVAWQWNVSEAFILAKDRQALSCEVRRDIDEDSCRLQDHLRLPAIYAHAPAAECSSIPDFRLTDLGSLATRSSDPCQYLPQRFRQLLSCNPCSRRPAHNVRGLPFARQGRAGCGGLAGRAASLQDLPVDTLVFLLGSRYCETDRFVNIAWTQFGNIPRGWRLVQAICDYVHDRIKFGYEHASPTKTAWDVHTEGRGVCRDFAHLAVTLCAASTSRHATARAISVTSVCRLTRPKWTSALGLRPI